MRKRGCRHNLICFILIEAAPIGNANMNATDGANKTSIMNNAGLSYPLLMSYLGQLTKPTLKRPSLLERDEDGIYRTTQTGLKFLQRYYQTEELV